MEASEFFKDGTFQRNVAEKIKVIISSIGECTTHEQLYNIWDKYQCLSDRSDFRDAYNSKLKQLKNE